MQLAIGVNPGVRRIARPKPSETPCAKPPNTETMTSRDPGGLTVTDLPARPADARRRAALPVARLAPVYDALQHRFRVGWSPSPAIISSCVLRTPPFVERRAVTRLAEAATSFDLVEGGTPCRQQS